jgi:dTDP-4-dehydrorhamnose reductase
VKFLVIGGSGFIGTHLMAELRQAGHLVIGTGSHSGLPEFQKFDLLEDSLSASIPSQFFKGDEPPVLVLTAVQGNMDQCLGDRDRSYRINVSKPIDLIREAASLGCRVVFLSTGHVFDGTVGNRREEDPVKPVNEYARQKLEVENFLLAQFPGSFIARMDKVIGEDLGHHHLLSEWWRQAQDCNPILCVKGMEISPTSVLDIARGLRVASERKLSGIYHLAGPDRLTRAEFAKSFCAYGNFETEIIEKPLGEFGFLDGRALRSSLSGLKFTEVSSISFSSADQIIKRFFSNIGHASSPTDH